MRSAPGAAARRWRAWLPTVAALILYLVALNIMREEVPAGLNNDAAEEALRGVYLLEESRFEPFSVHGITPDNRILGNSMETLFLYLLGVVARVLGTTTLTVHATTWLFALASLCLTGLLARRIDPSIPSWIPLLLSASSIWMFHYARSGLRANTAPFFLLVFTLLLDRAEQSTRRGTALACGAVLGLSLYGYTSCRVLPIAFSIHALARLRRAGAARRSLLRCYAMVLAAALVFSLPNLVSFWRWPDEFLLRGSYVLRGDPPVVGLNVLRTLILPFSYPRIEGVIGPTHYFDAVSVSLTAAGILPLHPIVGALFLIGLVRAWQSRKEPALGFLLSAWLAGTVVLGLSGPSLTRLLVLLPVYLVLATLALGPVLRFRGARTVIAAALLILTAGQARAYFVTYAQNPSSRRIFSAAAATPMGNRARALASTGARVVCVVSSDSNVVTYLTHDFRQRVRTVEFLNRPLDPGEIPLQEFRPDYLLMERNAGFATLREAFRRLGTWEPRPDFDEFGISDLWKRTAGSRSPGS